MAHEHRSRICVKCRHKYPPKADVCEACSAHLYFVCRKCHHRNPRALSTCEKCGDRLRVSRWQRFRKWATRSEAKIKPVEVLLAIFLVIVCYKISMMFIEFFSDMAGGG